MSSDTKQFLRRDIEYIKCLCHTIGEKDLDGSYDDRKIRYMMYKLGSLVYRSYHGEGDPIDGLNPSLNTPSKAWSSLDKLPIDHRMLQKV